MLLRVLFMLSVVSTLKGEDAGPRETVLLVDNKPLDLEWEKCLSARECIKTNVIDRVAELETQVQNATFGEVLEEKGAFINLSSKLKMKMIHKEDGRIAFRFVANNNPVDSGRGHIQEKHKALLIGFSLILFVLGVVSTTLKVNVFLALLGVAIGKILLLYVYTEHLVHHGHKHHKAGIHIHKAPVHHYKYSPVHVIEPVPIIEPEYHAIHEPYHHEHYEHDIHDDWAIGKRKRKSLETVNTSVEQSEENNGMI